MEKYTPKTIGKFEFEGGFYVNAQLDYWGKVNITLCVIDVYVSFKVAEKAKYCEHLVYLLDQDGQLKAQINAFSKDEVERFVCWVANQEEMERND